MSVPTLAAALRRRWRIWFTGSTLGLLLAIVIFFAFPADHTASTTLALAHPSGGDQARAMVTDARLLKTRSVAQGAIEALGLDVSPQQLVADYQVQILSDDLLKITASGGSDDDALRRVEAVASSFLAFRSGEIRRQASVARQSLEERRDQLTADLLAADDQIIAVTKPQGDAEVRALGELLVRRSALGDQLGSVRQRIEVATFDTESTVQRTRVVDPPGVNVASPFKPLLANVVAGTMLGFLLTGGWVVVQEVTTDRLRRRDEVAAYLGASVVSGTSSIRGPIWSQRHRFRRRLATPGHAEARVVDHLRGVLGRSGSRRPTLVVVSVDSLGAAALGLASLAAHLIREGKSVLVVDLTRRTILARLTKISAIEAERLPLIGEASALWATLSPIHADDTETLDRQRLYRELAARADIVLALATIDLAEGAHHLAEVASTAVVVVTAGRSSSTALRSVAQVIRSAGMDLDSAILVGADPHDESVGLERSPPGEAVELDLPMGARL